MNPFHLNTIVCWYHIPSNHDRVIFFNNFIIIFINALAKMKSNDIVSFYDTLKKTIYWFIKASLQHQETLIKWRLSSFRKSILSFRLGTVEKSFISNKLKKSFVSNVESRVKSSEDKFIVAWPMKVCSNVLVLIALLFIWIVMCCHILLCFAAKRTSSSRM